MLEESQDVFARCKLKVTGARYRRPFNEGKFDAEDTALIVFAVAFDVPPSYAMSNTKVYTCDLVQLIQKISLQNQSSGRT